MALDFQDIPVPFTSGADRSADDALIQPPGVVRLQGGEFADKQNIRAMDGLTAQAVTVMTGEVLPDNDRGFRRRLLTHKDELLLDNANGIYRQQVGGSFALAADTGNVRRDFLRTQRMAAQAFAEARPIQADDFTGPAQVAPKTGCLGVDAAVLGDYVCVVWCEEYKTFAGSTNSQLGWVIRHRDSDALVGRGSVRSATGGIREPRVVAFGGQFRIFYIDNGDLARLFIDPLQTQNVTGATVFTALGNILFMDVALSPTHFCISAVSSAPAVQNFIFTQAAPTVLVAAPAAATPANARHVGNTFINTDGLGINQGFVAFYTCVGTETIVRWYVTSPAGAPAEPGASGALTPNVVRCFPLKEYSGSAAAWPVLLDTVGSTPLTLLETTEIHAIKYNATAASPGSLASGLTTATIMQGHIVAGQPFSTRTTTDGLASVAYDGTGDAGLMLPVQYASTKQFVWQVVDIAKGVTSGTSVSVTEARFSVARVFDAGPFYENHFPLPGAGVIGRVCSATPALSTEVGGLGWYTWCAKFTPNITNVTDLGQNPTSIQRMRLTYEDPLGYLEYANLTYLAGGTPLVYDGQNVFEEGFHIAPEIIDITTSGVGPLQVGTYRFVAVFEWFDGQGNRWQSAPSAPFALTVGAANVSYTATLRAYQPTLKSGVNTVLYRTALNGAIYRRDSAVGSTPLTDAALASSELLYVPVDATTGIRANNALPSTLSFAVHQNRLVACGGEFERGFYYSKELSPRFPAEFNRVSGFGQAPDICGRLAVAASLDDKLVLLCENQPAVVFGQGPNGLWLQNGYSLPVPLQSGKGIRYDTPLCALVPDGIWYVTQAGPRLLTRGLTTGRGQDGSDLGSQAYGPTRTPIGRCWGIINHPSKSQVYFLAFDALHVYDYQRNKWSYRTDYVVGGNPASSMVAARGIVWLMNPTARSSPTSPLLYIDHTATPAVLVVETGWMSFAGVQRFQRLTHVQFLGQASSTGSEDGYRLEVAVYTDYDPLTVRQATTIITQGAAPFEPWNVEVQMAHQQSAAFKFIISLQPEAFGSLADFTLSSMLARVGAKRGGSKLQNSRRA